MSTGLDLEEGLCISSNPTSYSVGKLFFCPSLTPCVTILHVMEPTASWDCLPPPWIPHCLLPHQGCPLPLGLRIPSWDLAYPLRILNHNPVFFPVEQSLCCGCDLGWTVSALEWVTVIISVNKLE